MQKIPPSPGTFMRKAMKLKTVDEMMAMIDTPFLIYSEIRAEFENWQKELDVRAKDLTDTVLTVQKLSKEIDRLNTENEKLNNNIKSFYNIPTRFADGN